MTSSDRLLKIWDIKTGFCLNSFNLDSKINELAESLAEFTSENLKELQEMCKIWSEYAATEFFQFIEANRELDPRHKAIKEKIKTLKTQSAEVLNKELNTKDLQSNEEKIADLLLETQFTIQEKNNQ